MHIRHLRALLFAVIVLAVPAPVAADCQPAASVEEALTTAQVAFVGTVVLTAEGRAGAALAVEEIWVGEVAARVEVHGMGIGPEDSLMEDDRLWQEGGRYLVIPYGGEDGLLHDNICTATTEWRAELAELRPPDARVASPAVTESEASGTGTPVPWLPFLVVALAALVVVGAGLIAFRQGRPNASG